MAKKKVVVGTLYRGEEHWRTHKIKTFCSRMCSEKDILGNVAFRKFENVWLKKTRISLDCKLRLYEAQVVSISMYNCPSLCIIATPRLHLQHPSSTLM